MGAEDCGGWRGHGSLEEFSTSSLQSPGLAEQWLLDGQCVMRPNARSELGSCRWITTGLLCGAYTGDGVISGGLSTLLRRSVISQLALALGGPGNKQSLSLEGIRSSAGCWPHLSDREMCLSAR